MFSQHYDYYYYVWFFYQSSYSNFFSPSFVSKIQTINGPWGNREETVIHIISEWSQQTQKEYKTRHNWVSEGDPLGTVQGIKFWPYNQMVYTQTRIRPRKWDA